MTVPDDLTIDDYIRLRKDRVHILDSVVDDLHNNHSLEKYHAITVNAYDALQHAKDIIECSVRINKMIKNVKPCPEFADISMNKGHNKEQCDLDYGHAKDHEAKRLTDDGSVYIINWK